MSINRKSFADLDIEMGLPRLPPYSGEEFPLPAWYRSVYLVPMDQFTELDLSRSCHHRIHLDEIVPFALERVQENPIAGERYDGELLISLAEIRKEFWHIHPAHAEALEGVIRRFLSGLTAEEIEDQFLSELVDNSQIYKSRPSVPAANAAKSSRVGSDLTGR